jgi:hypothetical protein
MDETDPVARAQYRLRDDLELVQRYGWDEAADHFGGRYLGDAGQCCIPSPRRADIRAISAYAGYSATAGYSSIM